jgi:hypothetical protein
MKIDDAAYFRIVRPTLFSGSMNQDQVTGQTAVIRAFEKHGDDDPRKLAYILATFYHETAKWMIPVIETRKASEKKNPSVTTAIARLESAWAAHKLPWVTKPYWRLDADGFSWLGRGGPQVTHKENYLKAEKRTGIPFTKNPDRMLDPEDGAWTAIVMMMAGDFRPKFGGLSKFFNDTKSDWVGARDLINGDKNKAVPKTSQTYGTMIAGYAKQFHAAILAALEPSSVKPQDIVPPPPPPAPPASQSPVTWTGVAAGGTVAATTVKETLDYVNSTTATLRDTAGQAKDTITVVKETTSGVSGWISYVLNPPVLIALGIVVIAAIVMMLVLHRKAEKEAALSK